MDKNILMREIEKVYQHTSALKLLISKFEKIIILGNGGSNAIASHIAQDYTKQLGKKCFSFSDPSRLTCYINDYGMEHANQQFIKEFADKDTLVILISSSGNSINMLQAMFQCSYYDIPYLILTGFSEHNKIRMAANNEKCKPKLDVWVDSTDYGVIELTHEILLHSIIGD